MESPPNPIPKLPNDVVVEILTRLPVKPLSKFKCVSKSWLSMISSQRFIKTHLANSKETPNSLRHRIMFNCRGNFKECPSRSLLSEPAAVDSNFPSQFTRNSIWVVGSCDGLICLAIAKTELIIWNPTTGISKELPDLGVQINLRSYFAYGLGFDKSTDDYKVVGFFNSSWNFSEVIGKVYSLKTDRWRTINSFKGRWLMDDPATFANGKLYWIANSDLELKCGWDIVFLDLETEEYGVLEMPDYVKSGIYSRLGASEGRLFVMCSHMDSADVWIMDGCGVGIGTWSRVVSVPYVDEFLRYNYKKALHMTEDGEIVLICSSKVVVFDSRDCSFRLDRLVIQEGNDSETIARHISQPLCHIRKRGLLPVPCEAILTILDHRHDRTQPGPHGAYISSGEGFERFIKVLNRILVAAPAVLEDGCQFPRDRRVSGQGLGPVHPGFRQIRSGPNSDLKHRGDIGVSAQAGE